MKTLISILALSMLPLVLRAEETQSVELRPVAEAVLQTWPKDDARASKRWMTQKFEIRNVSGADFFVFGHSLESVFIDVLVKDPVSGEWVSRGFGYCGTGAGYHLVAAGKTFSAIVNLPEDLAGREFVITFRRYASDHDTKGIETKTPAMRMKTKP